MMYSICNGKLINTDEKVIHPDNRAFRYGEGLFETIRLHNAAMPLWNYHWQRLSKSLPLLYFQPPKHFNAEALHDEVLKLAAKNDCTNAARVRITFFKGEGGLWEEPSSVFNCIIQCWPLQQKPIALNENGLHIGTFPDGRKACDAFANLKSNNYLLYALAAQYAKQQKWNECIVLNQHERICDGTIANVFFVKNNIMHTPALSEACVAGVMRTYLLEAATAKGFQIAEGAYTIDELLSADEVFFTNAMYGIRWVKRMGEKEFSCNVSAAMFHDYIIPLFA